MANLPNLPNTLVTFTLKRWDAPLWSIEGQGPDYREMIAGLVHGFDACFDYMGETFEFDVTIKGEGEEFMNTEGVILRDEYTLDQEDIEDVAEDAKLPALGVVDIYKNDFSELRSLDGHYGWFEHESPYQGKVYGIMVFQDCPLHSRIYHSL